MFDAVSSKFLAPFDQSFKISDFPCTPDNAADKKTLRKQLKNTVAEISDLQRKLMAADKHSVLLVFQAMDAAGKDSTIRAVLSGVNPAGCQVFSFKKPSTLELDHDFLWRTSKRLPERGRIGIFNRSQYEEVLIVRVHPKILGYQRLPDPVDLASVWDERLESIADQEKHLARNGTVIIKFWLNVSREEQRQRFLARLEDPRKNWKFETGDVEERGYWGDYMHAYEEAIAKTSKPWAPWYAIPADNKPFMRYSVADIVHRTLDSLALEYPTTGAREKPVHDEMHAILSAQADER